jgi:hypothetical protein
MPNKVYLTLNWLESGNFQYITESINEIIATEYMIRGYLHDGER